MKARVKATGEIVNVYNWGDPTFRADNGEIYQRPNLDFDVEDENNPDYWTRLEHQYAGLAMQAYIIASHISQFSFCEGDMRDCKSIAHALVEKLKEKEERK